MSRPRWAPWAAALAVLLVGPAVVLALHPWTSPAQQASSLHRPTPAQSADRRSDPHPAHQREPRPPPQRPVTRALDVLHRWDARRSRAWASGSPARLRALYAPGSQAGDSDVRLLRRYRARGLRFASMRTQVLAVTVLEHRPGSWTLRVTDRLADAVAVHGGRRTTLPRDTAGTTVVALVRSAVGWRVAEARAVRPAPPRAATRASGGRR